MGKHRSVNGDLSINKRVLYTGENDALSPSNPGNEWGIRNFNEIHIHSPSIFRDLTTKFGFDQAAWFWSKYNDLTKMPLHCLYISNPEMAELFIARLKGRLVAELFSCGPGFLEGS